MCGSSLKYIKHCADRYPCLEKHQEDGTLGSLKTDHVLFSATDFQCKLICTIEKLPGNLLCPLSLCEPLGKAREPTTMLGTTKLLQTQREKNEENQCN
jgi:hypothetical protein